MVFEPPYDKFEQPIVEGGLILVNYREQDREVWVNPYLNFTGGLELNPEDDFRTWAIQVPTLLLANESYEFELISTLTTEQILTVEEVREANPGATYDPPVVKFYFYDVDGGFGFFPGLVNQGGTFHLSIPASSVSNPRQNGYLFFGVNSGQRYLPFRTEWEIRINQT
jgi:hypothetical protein